MYQPILDANVVNEYCSIYQDIFSDIRNYEHFKYLHLGLISGIPKKSLPAIAETVGLGNGQSLHHFLVNTPLNLKDLRHQRLVLTRQILDQKPFFLCIDETGDKKKGDTTDYVALQHVPNLNRNERSLVSLNSYALWDQLAFPLLFNVFKPRSRLKAADIYKTKPGLAIEMIEELQEQDFPFKLVLINSLYSETSTLIQAFNELNLDFIIAARLDYEVWLRPGPRVTFRRWQNLDITQENTGEIYSIREMLFRRRSDIRYYQIAPRTRDPEEQSSWHIITNLQGNFLRTAGNTFAIKELIEFAFKRKRDDLGWSDHRLTDYHSIERWWEIVYSAYLMVNQQTLTLPPTS
ncbi:IS701 family transposase [Anthocerotibacter panamensis]|uniref:IS701 family transposase n=1 Tax=Anthocerotibacter panamensis TaxID=2857077 RepID=UPI001C405D43|nr:transposase [Anthocerotibacter panamensis]